MRLPKICTNKFFLMSLSAFAFFIVFTFNINHGEIQDVKADYTHKIDKIDYSISKNSDKIDNISEKLANVDGKLDILIGKK